MKEESWSRELRRKSGRNFPAMSAYESRAWISLIKFLPPRVFHNKTIFLFSLLSLSLDCLAIFSFSSDQISQSLISFSFSINFGPHLTGFLSRDLLQCAPVEVCMSLHVIFCRFFFPLISLNFFKIVSDFIACNSIQILLFMIE